MRFILATVVMVLIIVASYAADRKYPRKRIYIIPVGIILLCSVVAGLSWLTPTSTNISQQQRLAILNEQPYFITWYNTLKQQIAQLDRFCTTYHKIITEYENDTLTAEQTVARLNELYAQTAKFDQSLQDILPPSELSQHNYTLVYNILEKTRIYSYKINEITRQSAVIITDGINGNIDKQGIVNNLNRAYAIEGPVLLDINTEVTQLKNNLTLPD